MKLVEKKRIDVVLTNIDENDVLIFQLDNDNFEKYSVNLNSSTSQMQLKEVFAKLLELLIEIDIELELKIAEGYSKGLYKDVCKEYIGDLNRELTQVKLHIKGTLR